jgi:hypothetical protein
MLPTARIPIAMVILFALFAVTPVCGRLFGCGCDGPWNGLFAYCASLRGVEPGCPWCEHPILGAAALLLPILGGIAFARLGRHVIRRWRFCPPGDRAEPAAALMGVVGALAVLGALGALTPLLLRIFAL